MLRAGPSEGERGAQVLHPVPERVRSGTGCTATSAYCDWRYPSTAYTPNTSSVPPALLMLMSSPKAPIAPSAAVGSSGPMPSATPAPAQPPTPESTATYCLPSGPRYVIGLPMIPEGVLNFHSSVPVVASTALSQPSIVP